METKVGDKVRVLKGQFANKTGAIVGIIACGKDYTDPYYEIDMDCQVPDKYKYRKTLITPNNVVGGFNAHDFEVIGKVEDEAKEPKFKAGEIVRYRYDGNLYIVECKTGKYYYALRQVGGDVMMHDVLESDLELVTEPKQEIKVGDVIDTPKGKGTVRISYGDYWGVQLDNGEWYIHMETNMPYAPYTEPKEQTEAEKTDSNNFKKEAEEWANTVSNAIKEYGDVMCQTYIDAHTEAYWDAYTADLAKEIAVKSMEKSYGCDPERIAEYVVSVAKAVVEGLKKK